MVVSPAPAKNQNGNFAPFFKQKPQLKQADDGNRLIFECSLSAQPIPSIEWWRGESLLTDEDGRTLFKIQSNSEPNSYNVSLILDDVVETDAGLYRVVAKNLCGEVAASINLNFSRKLFFFINFILLLKLFILGLPTVLQFEDMTFFLAKFISFNFPAKI
jgi:hypothetical protein